MGEAGVEWPGGVQGGSSSRDHEYDQWISTPSAHSHVSSPTIITEFTFFTWTFFILLIGEDK